MNFDTEEVFLKHRTILRSNPALTQAVPLILCFFLENKIIRHYKFGNFQKMLSHGLTAMLFANFVITYVKRPPFPEKMTQKEMAAETEYAEFIAMIGTLIYLSVIVCSLICILYFRFMLHKTWDNVSVRIGCFVVKAAMLTGG